MVKSESWGSGQYIRYVIHSIRGCCSYSHHVESTKGRTADVYVRLVWPMIIWLSGVPDLWDRNKILSGGDLSHYQVPHCIRVFFYFVWFVFIHHNFQFYFELCTYCYILDIYLSVNLNFVNYLLFNMKLLNYLFFNMFGSVLECCELTGVSMLWTRMALANKAKIGLFFKLGIYHGVYFDCIIITNLRGYIDLLDTSYKQLTYIYIHISCKCDTNRVGHFTLDAYASRPVAWSVIFITSWWRACHLPDDSVM